MCYCKQEALLRTCSTLIAKPKSGGFKREMLLELSLTQTVIPLSDNCFQRNVASQVPREAVAVRHNSPGRTQINTGLRSIQLRCLSLSERR
jgi:hypothetical protein